MTQSSPHAIATRTEVTDLGAFDHPAAVLEQGCRRLVSEGGPILQRYTVREIADAVGSVCRQWQDPGHPQRRSVLERLVVETGMTWEVLEQGLDIELRNYEARHLWSALTSELGEPTYLDAFQPNPATGGRSKARGPKLIAHWFSSTIPALPALGMIRGLLLKSPGVGRISSRERTFAPAFLGALSEALPGIEKAVWLTTWAPDLPGCLDAIARQCDAAIVYGSEQTCSTLRAHLAPHLHFVEHGHRVGITLIGRGAVSHEELAPLARSCALDIATFDQRACISPQVYLIEKGDSITPEDFAQALAKALAEHEVRYPGGKSTLDEDVTTALSVSETRFRGGEAYNAGDGWVLLEPGIERAHPTQGRRMVRVVPVEDLGRALTKLPFRGYLQNVAIQVTREDEPRILDLLAAEGATRICSPGKMPYPSMMWHHDGIECLATLTRWTDIEML